MKHCPQKSYIKVKSNYDGLEIQKNEDDTYVIQIKIPFLIRMKKQES